MVVGVIDGGQLLFPAVVNGDSCNGLASAAMFRGISYCCLSGLVV